MPTADRADNRTSMQLLFEYDVALLPQRPYGLLGTGARDVFLDFHIAPELGRENSSNVALRPQRSYELLGTGAQDGHFDFHTAPEL